MNPYLATVRLASQMRSAVVRRLFVEPILDTVRSTDSILEIGGGYNPRFPKRQYPNVWHLDHCTTSKLYEKYISDPAVTHLTHRIEHVDFISVGADFRSVVPDTLRFDVIYSSHALKHQIDLIAHFQAVECRLTPLGRAVFVIPDLRTCFDLYRFPTVTADVIATHLNKPRIHQARQVFDAVAQSATFNGGHLPGARELNMIKFSHDIRSAYDAAKDSTAPDAPYKDIHAWTFTPVSFRLLLTELNLLELVALKPLWISPRYGNQFCAVLHVAPRLSASEIASDRDRLACERLDLCRQLHGKRC